MKTPSYWRNKIMENLYKETLDKIISNGKTENDIKFIGSDDGDYYITFEDFKIMANVEYDDGYGAPEVDENLVVVFNDNSWLMRAQYDGSEWWEFCRVPTLKNSAKKIKSLFRIEEDD